MIFEIDTLIEKRVPLDEETWNKIKKEKHPVMKKYEDEVRSAVRDPEDRTKKPLG